MIQFMRPHLELFADHVQRREPLPDDWMGTGPGKPGYELLKRLHPNETPGSLVELGAKYAAIDEEIAQEAFNEKQAAKKRRALRNELCAVIADNEIGVLPSGAQWRWGKPKKSKKTGELARRLTRSGPKVEIAGDTGDDEDESGDAA
jgi:hypothetical protein